MSLSPTDPSDLLNPSDETAGPTGSQEIAQLSALFDELFPICRSITGPGYESSLDVFQRHMPLEWHRFETGQQVFDWKVPRAWRIRSAKLTGPDGKVYADFSDSNLNVVNYSAPVDRELSLEELQPHLHSLPHLPDATPYVTSYYNERWGFCLPDSLRKTMPSGRYHAQIDSEFYDGAVVCADAVLPGKSDQEFLLSSYLCHPSLANNELSGPLTLLAMYQRLAAQTDRYYTYRFLFNPETIGSICYLSRFGEHLRQKMVAGWVLTCTGGPTDVLSYKTTRQEDSLLDQLCHNVADHGKGLEIRPFTPMNGSDERQFCSPGFNLPMGQIARTKYIEYDGYHNSLDTKAFMGIERIVETADVLTKMLRGFEYTDHFVNTQPYGEVQLGRRGLYPTVNSAATWMDSNDEVFDARDQLNRILYLLNYSDGKHSTVWIANRLGCTVTQLIPVIRRLQQEGLLVREDSKETTQ